MNNLKFPIKKSSIYQPKAPRVKITVVLTLMVFIIALLMIQAFGILFDMASIKLGPVFMLFLIAAVSLFALSISKKYLQGIAIGKADIFVLLILVAVMIIALFYLKDLIPEIFKQSMMELHSFVAI